MLRDKTQARRIVPRWRASGLAAASADFGALKKSGARLARAADSRGTAFQAFTEERSLGTASDALAEALLERNTESAKSAATFVIQNSIDAPAPLVRLANDTLGKDASVPGQLPALGELDVARWRAILRLSPRNAAVWADMARHYSSQGDRRKAMKCMKTALQLAPDHRWMLRTASRFLVHQDEAAAAHKLLANHPRTKTDPWLMAAELACAHIAGKAPKFWKTANDALRFDHFAAGHISELATAISMMELESGKRKQARKLVQRALIAPTENTLAQVLWAKESRHLGDGIEGLDKLIGARRDAYEAAYKIRLKRGDIQDAIKACQLWVRDEPFASRPKIETSFVASLLDDHDLVIRTAKEALRIDGRLPNVLELNQLFSQLSSGKLDLRDPAVSQKILNRLKAFQELGGSLAVHATANLALLAYRSGNAEVGKDLYRLAIDLARKNDGIESAAMAATFAAREAILAGAPDADAQLEEAIQLAERSGSEAASFYNRKLLALSATPERAGLILSPSSTADFLKPVKILEIAKDQGGFVLTVGRT
ncbi:hypothetical protein ACS5PN_12445 [Roseateles sp. NT4]|uniref:hypothetical protein n=1 Tax=Roseateles sp. NT4 TaxID=3453715 RepID=UPI003EEE3E1C